MMNKKVSFLIFEGKLWALWGSILQDGLKYVLKRGDNKVTVSPSECRVPLQSGAVVNDNGVPRTVSMWVEGGYLCQDGEVVPFDTKTGTYSELSHLLNRYE